MYQRNIKSKILSALKDTSVILLNGARQTGKSTLVKMLANEQQQETTYSSFDDLTVLSAATDDTKSYVRNHNGILIIDEAQKLPELFSAIKTVVDNNSISCKFLLTGSANIFMLPKISESLAGRMEIISLYPLSQGEILGIHDNFIDRVFAPLFAIEKIEAISRSQLFDRILIGGYPRVLQRENLERRFDWFASYISAILQRDVKDISHIENLAALPNLLSLLAARSSSFGNIAEISRTLGLPATTISRYLTILQATFLLQLIPAWSKNFGKRLVKTPKIYLNDTGLLSYLLGIDHNRLASNPNLCGPFLENFVVMELQKQLTWGKSRAKIFHYRTHTGNEVDIVLENTAGDCVGIEVKASSEVVTKDFQGLKHLAEMMGDKFIRGIVLYTGNKLIPFGNNLYAVPVSALWTS